MLFLIRTMFLLPAQMSRSELATLREEESRRAHELQEGGVLRQLWRESATGAGWGVWEAADEAAALKALGSLPAFPAMTFDVHQIVDHPNALVEHQSLRSNL